MLVLRDDVHEIHKTELGRSLLQRLHEFYHKEMSFDNRYTGRNKICNNFLHVDLLL